MWLECLLCLLYAYDLCNVYLSRCVQVRYSYSLHRAAPLTVQLSSNHESALLLVIQYIMYVARPDQYIKMQWLSREAIVPSNAVYICFSNSPCAWTSSARALTLYICLEKASLHCYGSMLRSDSLSSHWPTYPPPLLFFLRPPFVPGTQWLSREKVLRQGKTLVVFLDRALPLAGGAYVHGILPGGGTAGQPHRALRVPQDLA